MPFYPRSNLALYGGVFGSGLPSVSKDLNWERFQTRRRMFTEYFPDLYGYVVQTRDDEAKIALNLSGSTDNRGYTSMVFLNIDKWFAIGESCSGRVSYTPFFPTFDGPITYGLVVRNRRLVASDIDKVVLISDHGFPPIGFELNLFELEHWFTRINGYENDHIDYIHRCLSEADSLKRVRAL